MTVVVSTTTNSKPMKELEREINLELTKVNKEDDLRILVSFTVDKTLNVDWVDASTLLDRRTVDKLIKQPTHVIAYYIRNMVLSINGWNTTIEGEIGYVDPALKPYVNSEYGSGWWFNEKELDSPDINLRTSGYIERIREYNTRLKEKANAELSLDWEIHLARNVYYPRVYLNWDGSGYNLTLFDLDYSYQLLRGDDFEFNLNCLINVITSLRLLKP